MIIPIKIYEKILTLDNTDYNTLNREVELLGMIEGDERYLVYVI